MQVHKQLQKVFLENKDPFNDILGQDSIKQQVKSAMLMARHILIVGASGIGKTTLARNIAKLLPDMEVNDCNYNCDPKSPSCPGCLTKKNNGKTKTISGARRFVRIQGSPDLTVEDLIGDIDPIKAMKFGPLSIEAFTPGKIFKANNGILFFDEVNRCPEKLQNALLQVLDEGKVTVGSYDVELPANFIFIGTMNPHDTSTERLSDVFLDRFDVAYMGYPKRLETEKEIVTKNTEKSDVDFPEKLFDFTMNFVRLLRESKDLEKKPSVRASMGLYERACANALLKHSKKVAFEDVEEAVSSVLSHRISLKPSVKYIRSPSEFIEEEFRNYSKDFSELKHEKGGSR